MSILEDAEALNGTPTVKRNGGCKVELRFLLGFLVGLLLCAESFADPDRRGDS